MRPSLFRSAQKAEKLWRYLTRRKASGGRRARRSKGKITDKVHISQRSEAADERTESGHWEADLVICKHNRPLLVLHERKTRLTVMTRLSSKSAAETVTAITEILTRLAPSMRRSVTFASRDIAAQCPASQWTTAQSSLVILCSKTRSASQPTSVTPTPPGKRAGSRTPPLGRSLRNRLPGHEWAHSKMAAAPDRSR